MMMTVQGVIAVVLQLQTVVLLTTITNVVLVVQADSKVFQVDGSGITSVQECLWDMMHQIETAASVPVRLSYRGLADTPNMSDNNNNPAAQPTTTLTGTQFAEQEFLNSILENVRITSYNDNTTLVAERAPKMSSLPMFVIIDKPISKELYEAQFDNNNNYYDWDQIAFNGGIAPTNNESASRFIQIPLLASPIGFFHSVPQSSVIDQIIDNDDAGLVWNTSSSTNLVNGKNDDASETIDADEMNAINDIESIYEDESAMELYVDACTIMKLYDGVVTTWKDVVQSMPDMADGMGKEENVQQTPDNKITSVRVVAIRGESSATLAISTYLSQFCPDFATSRVSSKAAVAFPTNTDNINFVDNYEEMMVSLTENSGSFGYMPTVRTSYNSKLRSNNDEDDLIFLDSKVQEVFIPIMKDASSDYLTSIDTMRTADGVALAIDRANFPTNALYNYNNKELFTSANVGTIPSSSDPNVPPNVDNRRVWPMLTVIFAMVPKHLENLVPDPVERSLLYAFLESFYNIDYRSICYEKYNYASLPDDIVTFAKDGINFVRNEPTNNYNVVQPQWMFESSTSAISDIDLLQTPYLLSSKRQSYTETIVNDLNNRVNEVTATIEDSQMGLAILEEEIMNMKLHVNGKENTINTQDNYDTDLDLELEDDEEFLEDIANAIEVSLILSSISFTLWMIVGCIFFCRCFYRCYRARKGQEQSSTGNSPYTTNSITNLHDFGTEPDGIFSKGRSSTNGGSSVTSINLNAKRYEEEFLDNNDLQLSASVSKRNGSSTPGVDKTDSTDDLEYGVSPSNSKVAVL